MITLKVDITNCYGIGEMSHEFNFERSNTHLIYAPNGTMKSSFAKVMKYYSAENEEEPSDRLYPERQSVHAVTVDGVVADLRGKSLVIDPEIGDLDASDKISAFIASKELKEAYDKIYSNLDQLKNDAIKDLKRISGSSDCEKELLEAFRENESDTVIDILERLMPEIEHEHEFYDFKYNDVFDKKGNVAKFLDKHRESIEAYFETYQRVLAESAFFKGDEAAFGTYQANSIIKSIEGDSFFKAGHHIELREDQSIKSHAELQQKVQDELDSIVKDEDLRQVFDKIDKALGNNAELRNFKAVIESDNLLLVPLNDYPGFKRRVWIGFLCKVRDKVRELIGYYESVKPNLEEIIERANEEVEIWRDLVVRFNERFTVPFTIHLRNQEDVLLKKSQAILEFEFNDSRGEESKLSAKEVLLPVLSKGERRAYFILQLLFEINALQATGERGLLIFDDVSDSFDYKNKYAIVEYINELHEADKFRIIILTHNFDFYRTIASRLGLPRGTAVLMAQKSFEGRVHLSRGQYLKDVFAYFLNHTNDIRTFLTIIPFFRNIVEYTEETECPDYLLLTSCLHIKEDTRGIKASDVVERWNGRFPKQIPVDLPYSESTITDLLYQESNAIVNEYDAGTCDSVDLKNKVVLSITIRLKAEEFILSKIELPNEPITSNQTRELVKCYKDSPQSTPDTIGILERVAMMTPENIHLNAFMYEPLLDMSIDHLIRLYSDVNNLGLLKA